MSNSSSCGSCGQPHGLWATDRLTLLLDRWGWDAQAPQILAASRSTALLVVDLDNFKRVNDRFGHVAGDAVLKAVADTLRGSTRKGDLLGRYGGHGGDEFLVMLPETGMEDAVMVAERIQLDIRAMIVDAPTQAGTVALGGITASFGVSVGTPGTDLESLVVEADAALRRAKRTGRDRIRTPKRSLRVPLAIVTACAAGAVLIVSVTGDARSVHQAAPEPPRPVVTPTVTLPPVTVPTTVTMTATVPPRPVTPVAPARQPKQTTPTSTPPAEPAVRSVETPPKAKPCQLCEMVNGVMRPFMPFMPR